MADNDMHLVRASWAEFQDRPLEFEFLASERAHPVNSRWSVFESFSCFLFFFKLIKQNFIKKTSRGKLTYQAFLKQSVRLFAYSGILVTLKESKSLMLLGFTELQSPMIATP